jgi:hypothetical protein
MSLERIVQVKDAVDRLCAGIDAGLIHPTEQQMVAIAEVVSRDGGLLAHDLLCKLASRCRSGRQALKDVSQ